MKCECETNRDYIAITGGVDGFVAQFTFISTEPQKWTKLYQCQSCNQHWQIDAGAEIDRRVPLAIKIAGLESWQTFNDRPIRRQYFIDFHGGLTDLICQWKGCFSKSVKGMVLCPDHVSNW